MHRGLLRFWFEFHCDLLISKLVLQVRSIGPLTLIVNMQPASAKMLHSMWYEAMRRVRACVKWLKTIWMMK